MTWRWFITAIVCPIWAAQSDIVSQSAARPGDELDRKLAAVLTDAHFTGRIQALLEKRLGRPLNPKLAEVGRLLWFDTIGGLHDDNTCGGCHSPTNGMGDTQSIAIGIQNNNLVGPQRRGPRNQRRTPTAANTAFYPKLMWNGRFLAPSGNPFDNSGGYLFPPPESDLKFPPRDPLVTHLLIAQAHIPPTEQVEVAGFTGTAGAIGPRFDAFDDGRGANVPPPDISGSRNEPIRQEVLRRLNNIAAYRRLFGAVFPEVALGQPIDFVMFGRAIAEFEFTLTFADAPLDPFARGERGALTGEQKRGALLFFGKAGCVRCHAVAGESNEMFSDFQMHAAGIPQIAPFFGAGQGNVIFDGAGEDEDFGLEQVTGENADRYKFRTSPLRNVALQAAFFHNGAFTRLRDAVAFHLDASNQGWFYNPARAGVAPDLRYRLGPIEPVLRRLDPLLRERPSLGRDEVDDLVAFLEEGLLDSQARRRHLCDLVPESVPSGMRAMQFGACASSRYP